MGFGSHPPNAVASSRADVAALARTRRSRRRRAVLVAVALGIAVLAVTAARASMLVADLQEGRARLIGAFSTIERASIAVSVSDATQVTADLQAADDALGRARDAINGDPFIVWLRPLPVVGEQLRAIEAMVAGAMGLTGQSPAINDLMIDGITARDSADGALRLRAFARFAAEHQADIEDLVATYEEAHRLVSDVPQEALVGPLSDARTTLLGRLDQLRPIASGARQAVAILPSIMGIGGERRYLVLALDTAELRPVGGLITSFATPRMADGVLGDMTFRDIASVDRYDQAIYVAPPRALADHLLGDRTWQVAHAGWWPDFASNARDARRLYQIETGDGDFHGTIAFTPAFVDALLEVTGPVGVPEAGITVHPGETYLVSLEQVEVLNKGQGRKQFLADLASGVLERLFDLPAERYLDVVAAFAKAARTRDLQILLDDPRAQVVLTENDWYKPFSFSETGDRLAIMEANVAPVSKLNALLDLKHELVVELQANGSAKQRLVTTFTNRFGPAMAAELERVRSTFGAGSLGSYHRRYLHPDADMVSVMTEDSASPANVAGRVEREARAMVVGNYQLIEPGTVRLETLYMTPHVVTSDVSDPASSGTYRLEFRKQPGRSLDRLKVVVRVPDGTRPTKWTPGGIATDATVSFSVTTEYDRAFEVVYEAP
jgi:hypothetical protein